MYLAIFTHFLRFSHSFLAHPINLKGLVVFFIFFKDLCIFLRMILQNSRTIPGQKALFSNSRSFSRQGQIQGLFQVCSNPVRACLILYAILTPKFNLWIYVWVMHCDLDLRSQFLKKCTDSRSPILFMVAFHIWYVDTSWALADHQQYYFHVTVTLTSGFSSSKVELRAYLYII